MPPNPGETTVLNLFADIHYSISPPGQRPQHDRFEKGCYVYLYSSQTASGPRMEIANNPGTPHQDAFAGSLSNVSLTFSRRQQNLVTATVMRRAQEHDQMWQLKSYDLALQRESIYLCTAIDMYFWVAEDAAQFIEACSSLPVGELSVDGKKVETRRGSAQAGEHRDQMSPVVQKLEQAAITSPSPQGYPQRDSVSTASSISQPQPQRTPTFPPPPPAGPAQAQSSPANAPAPQPLAYNPAAPPAPEPIAHREKTPPPIDSDAGTGLNNAAIQDQAAAHTQQSGYPYNGQQQQYAGYQGQQPPQQHPQQQASFSPPPLQHQGSFPPPPPQQHQTPPAAAGAYPTPPASQHTQQYPHTQSQTQTPLASPPPTSPGFPQHQQPQRQSTLPFQQYASPPTSPGYPPSASAPSPYNPQIGSPPPTQNPTHPSNPGYPTYSSPPPGAHPQYPQHPGQYPSYGSPPPPQQGQVPSAQSIHSQHYQPSESETQKPAQGGGTSGRTDKIEKGVNRFLKKLDKHL